MSINTRGGFTGVSPQGRVPLDAANPGDSERPAGRPWRTLSIAPAAAALVALVPANAAAAGSAAVAEGISIDGVAIGMPLSQAVRRIGKPIEWKSIPLFDIPGADGCRWERPWGHQLIPALKSATTEAEACVANLA